MTRWLHEGYSEDLRQKIVSSVERGMSKAQAARTFEVSLSSVKRYVDKARRGQSLAPKKSPSSPPKLDQKATKLLEEDLKERHQDGSGSWSRGKAASSCTYQPTRPTITP